MFGRIGKFFRDIQIDSDFATSERFARKAHLSEAESLYSVKSLESERILVLMRIDHNTNVNYDYFIQARKKELVALETHYNEKNSQLIVLSRDYQSEIKLLHDRKQTLYELKGELFEKNKILNSELKQALNQKGKAHENLRECKGKVTAFRKKYHGDDLPTISLFGPTLGELRTLKRDRDSAYESTVDAGDKIYALKAKEIALQSEIAKVESEIIGISSQISSLKGDRAQMFKLKELGVLKEVLKSELAEISASKIVAWRDIKRLEVDKVKFLEKERDESGLYALEDRIKFLLAEKGKFVKGFDLKENRLKRKKAHRIQWLKRNS